MFERVTDPEILKKLNSPKYEKVNNPSIIEKLNKKNNTYELPNYPFVTRPPTPEESKKTSTDVKQALMGGMQSFINTPEQIANVFGQHLYNQFNFSPKTPASKIGEVGGDILSYFLPGGTAKLGLKAASFIPSIGKGIKLSSEALKNAPIANLLTNMGKSAGEAALFQKEKFPQSSISDVSKAGSYGATLSGLTSALTNSNPFLRNLAKLGTGGLLGYQYNGIPGALEGMALGTAMPAALKELGIGSPPVSTEFLTQPPNELARLRVEAANRLGTPIRPSEAFVSPGIARIEGMIPRSEAGGQIMSELGQERLQKQKSAINNLLDNIYDKSDKSENKIRSLYKNAYKNNLNLNVMNELQEDPVIGSAFNKVNNDPAYMKDLKDIRVNNFAYLDQVKRFLDDMQGKAIKSGENNLARIYKDSSDKIIKEMDNVSDDYKIAREEAQRKIIRRDMDKALNKKSISGINFFNKFLSNDQVYNELIGKLKKVPEAKKKLEDMKLAWEHLIGSETPRTAAGSAARSMSTARSQMSELWNKFKDLFGGQRDIQRAQFIHDPNWWDKFDEVMKYRDKLQKREELGKLLSKSLTGGIMETAKEKRD